MAPGDGDPLTFSEQHAINAAQEVTNEHLQKSINDLKEDLGSMKTDLGAVKNDVSYIRGRYEAGDKKKDRSSAMKTGLVLAAFGSALGWLIDHFTHH